MVRPGPPPEVSVLGAIAEADRLFADLAVRLRQRSDVRDVHRTLRVAPGPVIDFGTDAELSNGEALSWALWATFSDGEWTLESSVRRNHSHGQDVVRMLPTRYALDAEELAVELVGAAAMAVQVWSDEDPMFSDEGYGD